MDQIVRGSYDPAPPEGGTTRMPQTSGLRGHMPISLPSAQISETETKQGLSGKCLRLRGADPWATSSRKRFIYMLGALTGVDCRWERFINTWERG
jgi:hypothetical protein